MAECKITRDEHGRIQIVETSESSGENSHCISPSGSRCADCENQHDDWPDGEGGHLCQECWETQCSEEWWKQVVAIDELIYFENLEIKK